MARPPRIEFPGANYHVTARGNAPEAIFRDDADRDLFPDALGEVVTRFGWRCHAYCLRRARQDKPQRDAAMRRACLEYGYTMPDDVHQSVLAAQARQIS